MPPEKALGPDGFTGRFFKESWEIIKGDVLAVFHKFFTMNRSHFAKINTTNIILLPKRDQSVEMADFSPISLIHSMTKLISKVLAVRLAKHMDRLISNNQSAFIRTRCIQDNFLYVQNLARSCHRSKTPVLMLKLDIAKAFDSVSWPYMLDILQWRGFGQRWREWISLLLGTATSRVTLNGAIGQKISHRCGVHQGDPLPPYLFILAMDTLQHLLEVVTQ